MTKQIQNLNPKIIKVNKGEQKTILIESSGRWIIELVGEGARANILGILIGKGEEEYSIHTIQRHLAANTKSDLLIKSVLFDNSKLTYDGLIKIEKDAQRSNAYQRNENLVMNEGVKVDSKPELEILANDVRCTHGATIGKIDIEQIFYLQSRGLTKKQAEGLIIAGFLEGVVGRIEDKVLQQVVRDKIAESLKL